MNVPLRRGFCPGLSAPMQTGDGMLVRLLPIGTIALGAFAALAAAARTYGNGIVEITARGSIQVRGLSAASAPLFAAAIDELGIAAADGVPVHADPLAGLDPGEIVDSGKFAADLRAVLAQRSPAARLAPKVSVVIDGGGAVGLDELAADVRLRAQPINGDVALQVSVGGDGASAMRLGLVAPADGVEITIRLLEVVAQRGRDARARDLLVAEGIEPFCLAVRDLLLQSARPRESADPELDSRLRGNERIMTIGQHTLRGGSLACGLGLAFGHADATSLAELTKAAAAAGAVGMRAAPGRALVVVGLTRESLPEFVGNAERLGFIVRPDDRRCYVIACAGAPICASAHLATRAIAPRIAAESARLIGRSFTIHLSGCAKGCAHPAPVSLTIVGTPGGCALVANGSTRDVPFASVPVDRLPAAIAHAVREHRHV